MSDLQAHSSEAGRLLQAAILDNCKHPFVRSPEWLPHCGLCGAPLFGWKPADQKREDEE